METLVHLTQALSGILMITLILMQSRGAGLSETFGGTDSAYRTKRGAEKLIFNLTIFFSGVFLMTSAWFLFL